MLDIHFNLFFIFTILFIGIKFVKSFYISLCTFRRSTMQMQCFSLKPGINLIEGQTEIDWLE